MARTRLVACASIPLLSLSLVAALGGPASAAAPASSSAVARQGASWLATQLTPAGYVKSPGGTVDYGSTAQVVIALHAAGVGGTQAERAEGYLEAHAAAASTTTNPGQLARLVLAAVASGTDPHAYGGVDLVAALLATQRTTGTDAGLFGSTAPTFDGAFRQGLALAALAAAGVTNAAGTTWLVDQQCADGGWEAYRADTSVACTPPDPTTFSGPDSNSTAAAVEGLVAQGVAPATSPLTFLHGLQASTGGFAFYGGAADPDSTALVVQALVALGEDPSATSWTAGGRTPFQALAAFQLSCATSAPGAFFFGSASSGASLIATLDAIPAAAGVALPLAASTPAAAAPSACPPASSAPASSTPTASPSAVPAAVAGEGGSLPNTGGRDTGLLVVVALALIATGGLTVVAVRRRTGSERA